MSQDEIHQIFNRLHLDMSTDEIHAIFNTLQQISQESEAAKTDSVVEELDLQKMRIGSIPTDNLHTNIEKGKSEVETQRDKLEDRTQKGEDKSITTTNNVQRRRLPEIVAEPHNETNPGAIWV